MSFTAVMIAVFLPVACIAAASGLMRLFDVRDATIEQSQAEAEKLLAQVNREATISRRVRAGAPSNATLIDLPRFASPSAIGIGPPSAQEIRKFPRLCRAGSRSLTFAGVWICRRRGVRD